MNLISYAGLRAKGIPYTRFHISRLVKDEAFPRPIALSTKRIAWLESEVDDWIAKLVEKSRKIAA